MWAVFSESEMYREKEDVEIAMEAEDADTKDRLAHGAVGPASCMGPRSGSESMPMYSALARRPARSSERRCRKNGGRITTGKTMTRAVEDAMCRRGSPEAMPSRRLAH